MNIKYIIILLFIGTSFFSCKREKERFNVSLTSSKNIWCALPIIAQEKGFFKEENLDVKINFVQVAKFSMDALIANSTDFAMVVDINLAYLGFTGNSNVEVLATVVKAYDGAIVARKDHGIETPKDLSGKKVGILQGTTSQIFADKFLEKHLIDSVNILNLQPISIQSSVISDEIDAGSIWQPFVYNIEKQLGENAIVFKDSLAYTGYMNLAVRKDWLGTSENNKKAKSFLIALKKANQYIIDNPESSKDILSKIINLDKNIVESIWHEYKFDLNLDKNELLGVIKSEGEWIKETQKNFIDKPFPNYETYFENTMLNDISRTEVPILNNN